MRDLGMEPLPVETAGDRSPIWPEGLVGSISHSRSLAGAAVALRGSGIRAIGLDLEEATPLQDELVEEVCVAAEREWLAARPLGARGLLAKAIFCAKEAAYKCQYPLTRQMIGFDSIRVELSSNAPRFTAHFRESVGQFHNGSRLAGDIWMTDNHLVALLALD